MTSTDVQTKPKYGVVGAIVAIVFALFFAYDLFEAIANVIGVIGGVNHTNEISKDLGLAQAASIPWLILVVDILLAPVLYAIAFFIGRRRPVLSRAAIFLVALAANAALSLSIEEGFSKFFS
jgi:hypothetical protein